MAQKSADPSAWPQLKISRRGAERLKSGHVWVYRSDLISADSLPPGSLVELRDERGRFLGTALYSTASQIAVRVISRDKVSDLAILLRDRIHQAICLPRAGSPGHKCISRDLQRGRLPARTDR